MAVEPAWTLRQSVAHYENRGCPQGRGQCVVEAHGGATEKSWPGTRCGSVPKLTQVGEESILTALERMVLKELGNLTP
jgi:hypothetical protein